MNYQEDVEPDMFQREHHKTKYHLVKLWPELVSSSWIYISFFFHLTYYKSNLDHLTSQPCIIYICDVYRKKYIHLNIDLLIFLKATKYWLKSLTTMQSLWADTCTLRVPIFCSSYIMMSYCVSITEQTTAKSYLFVLYNKKKTPELNR
jgi:hypothetical protein